ncbi:MAG TPA: DUF669 domain-containing protein, partial [Quisquiliibacterium sp.]|nr:DUF669 domain-containing protein [Quisquiliibacterium sp.]
LIFDATTVAPQATYTPIPAGVYTAAIVDSDVKPTQKGGTQAVFTLQVVDGPFAGRKVFARLNVRNPSAEAERIGQAQLSALQHACGVLQMQDTSQLHGKVIRARITVRKDETGQYGDSNDVKGFEAVGGAQMPVAAPAAQAAAPAGAAVPPWQKARTA